MFAFAELQELLSKLAKCRLLIPASEAGDIALCRQWSGIADRLLPPLKPEDVFLPKSGWDTWIEKRLDSYLQKVLDSNGNDQRQYKPGDLPGIVTNPADWKLDAKGFSIFFQPYQVACYACTPQPLVIPWSDLKPYLQPSFVLPK